MKVCSKCNESKYLCDFHKKGKGRLASSCKLCESLRKKQFYAENKERILKRTKLYYENNIEFYKKYNLKRYRRKREFLLKQCASYKKRNKKAHTAHQAKRRASKLKATLPGYDKELRGIYDNCPKGCHVDHIIPLQGRNVKGLHVPWNLQYLPASENLKKGNKCVV